MKIKVYYDNLVTDDVICDEWDNITLQEAEERAYKRSKSTGLSEGNYAMYYWDKGYWKPIEVFYEYLDELERERENACDSFSEEW